MAQTLTLLIGVAIGGILGFLVGLVLTHDTMVKHKK